MIGFFENGFEKNRFINTRGKTSFNHFDSKANLYNPHSRNHDAGVLINDMFHTSRIVTLTSFNHYKNMTSVPAADDSVLIWSAFQKPELKCED
jgi:hypothetical protein